MTQNTMEKLFSYGTLQQQTVQEETFQRILTGKKDTLTGYRMDQVKITDPGVVALSGQDIHHILVPTGQVADAVEGMVFDITHDELLQADAYEVEDYKRIQVVLQSGTPAWVYVRAEEQIIKKGISGYKKA